MSMKYVGVILCFFTLLVSGCAHDKHGHGYYKGGSAKDTHLKKAKVKKRRYKRVAYRRSSYKRVVRKKKTIATKPHQVAENSKNEKAATKPITVAQQDNPQNNNQQNNNQQNSNQPTGKLPSEKQEPVIKKEQSAAKEKVEAVAENRQSEKAVVKKETYIGTNEKKKADLSKEGADQGSKDKRTISAKVSEKTAVVPEQKAAQQQKMALHLNIPIIEKKKEEKNKSINSSIIGENSSPFTIVKVHYATDRNLSGYSSPKKIYGGKRSSISYGTAEISIPRRHKVGEIETPSVWRLEFRPNEKKHVILKSVTRRSKKKFFQEVRNNIKLSHGKNALIFIHGYNIEFHEAALRTAQIAYDLKFDGAPIFYSWPSSGTYKDYTRDETNVRWTQPNMKRFLKDFVQRSDAENIYIIAHSMGARALTGAVAELVREMPSIKNRIKEILLAAPDIDAEVFKRDIAPKLVKAARNVTLYASADDKALKASKAIHGLPRAGDAGSNVVVVEGIDTIDATGIDTSLFGHNYFARVPTIVTDILSIIKYGQRPKDRSRLVPVLASDGQYWAFRKSDTIIINGTTLMDLPVGTVGH